MDWLTGIALLAGGICVVLGVVVFGRSRTRRRPSGIEALVCASLRARFRGADVAAEDGVVYLCHERAQAVASLTHLKRVIGADVGRAGLGVDHVIAELDRALRRRPLSERWERECLDTLLPVPLPLDRAEAVGDCARATLLLQPDLAVGFVREGPHTGQWLLQRDVELWGADLGLLLERSRHNLWLRSRHTAVMRDEHDGVEIYFLRGGDGLDSSRLLLPEFWQEVAGVCGADLLLAVPTRDRVYAAPVDRPHAVDRLLSRASADWLGRPHAVSPRAWIWRGNRLERWTLHS